MYISVGIITFRVYLIRHTYKHVYISMYIHVYTLSNYVIQCCVTHLYITSPALPGVDLCN